MNTFLINLNHSDKITDKLISQFYQPKQLQPVVNTALINMIAQLNSKAELEFPYFPNVGFNTEKPLELDIYITDLIEGKQLNLDARGKDYATNILSYPSDLPAEVLNLLPSLPLGELVICHEVVEKQALEQEKTIKNHLHHLLVHGILHLLGFDHELGEVERLQMEGFEIKILAELEITNPYE